MNKKGLGRGLESLFGLYEEDSNEFITNTTPRATEHRPVTEIDINLIQPNPNQPRKHFDETALDELATSIKIHGVIQPLVLNKLPDNNYMIIAGERRWRASKIAGLKTVPAVIREFTERQIKEISLIENLQREDLNPIEAARAIKQLMDEYKLTQEIVSERIGKSRSNIANTLRLLTLYPEVIKLVEDGKLSAGHARTLVVVEDTTTQLRLANQACDGKMTVRELEKAVKNALNNKKTRSTTVQEQSLELKDLIQDMQRVLATKVSAIGNDHKGRIYIDYYSRDDLDRIADLMTLLKNKKK